MNEQQLAPELYRQRYFELKAKAQEANARRPAASHVSNPKVLPRDVVLVDETIPAGWYWTCRVARGQSLRLINEHGTDGVSALFWNAWDPSERLNPADSVKVQWTARLSRGRLLLSDMGRALVSITEDTCGLHDCIAGCSSRESDNRKFGAESTRRNSRDNFILAAAKHGLSARDVGPCVTFFAPVVTDEAGRLAWRDGAITAGDYVDLRAEMDLIAAFSNCPHPLSQNTHGSARDIRVQLWNSPPAGETDLCRSATEEALRAFENTDAYLARETGGRP